jgi:sRNA-binding carbon storage regulator CsrA
MSRADRISEIDPEIDSDGDQILLGIDRGDVSLAVAAPRSTDREEIEEILAELPDSIETVERLGLIGGEDR